MVYHNQAVLGFIAYLIGFSFVACGGSPHSNGVSHKVPAVHPKGIGELGRVPLGHRVLKVGGCLGRSGIRLIPPHHSHPEVMLGGEEVLGSNGLPLTVGEFEQILKKCHLLSQPASGP
jgi:hypothetical protein